MPHSLTPVHFLLRAQLLLGTCSKLITFTCGAASKTMAALDKSAAVFFVPSEASFRYSASSLLKQGTHTCKTAQGASGSWAEHSN